MPKIFTLFLSLLFAINLQAQDALNMTALAQWDVDTLPMDSGRQYSDIWGYTDCDNGEYAIMGSASRIHFLNVTDPTEVYEINSFPGGQVTSWRDIKTYKDHAYAVSDNVAEGLMIFDLSNLPDSVTMTAQLTNDFTRAHNLYIEEEMGRMYIVGSDNNDMLVYDLTNLDAPMLMAAVALPNGGYVHDVYVKDNIAYCSHGFTGFFVWDLTDPNNPVSVASTQTAGYNHSSWVTEDGRYAIFAEEVPIGMPLGVIDLENMHDDDISTINTFKFPLLAPADTENRPHNPFIRGDYAIVSYYHDGVQVINIADPMNPELVAYYDTYDNSMYADYFGAWGVYPFLPSGNILVSDIDKGLFVMSLDSIQLPAMPTAFDHLDLSAYDSLTSCAGEEVAINVPGSANEYNWFLNNQFYAFGPNVNFTESGSYSLNIVEGPCSQTSEHFELIFNEGPDLSMIEAQQVELCEGDSFLISAPMNLDFYLWMNNGNVIDQATNSIYVNEDGEYSLLAYLNGCPSSSEHINIDFLAMPDATILEGTTITACPGEMVTLTVQDDMDSEVNWIWNLDGDLFASNTPSISTEQSGTYIVSGINSAGCSTNSSATVSYYEAMIPVVAQNGNVLSSTSATTYQWFGNGMMISGATSQDFEPTMNGVYYVLTTDVNGCTSVSEDFIFSISDLTLIENVIKFEVYPNPVVEQLTVDLAFTSKMPVRLDLISVEGKIIESRYLELINQRQQFDMSELPSGIYFLQMVNEYGTVCRKVVR